ncbi:MAG: hypothetical protein WCP97_02380 [bacterium]
MTKQLAKDTLLWGFLLWLIGYILGFIFFFLVPKDLIGWFVSPIGILITIWVLLKKVQSTTIKHYLIITITWTALAIILDYLFLVKLLSPTDNYYKLDVYMYYATTALLPLVVGWWKINKTAK